MIRHFFRLHFIAALSVVCLSLSLCCLRCMLVFETARKGKKKVLWNKFELGFVLYSVLFNAQFLSEGALSAGVCSSLPAFLASCSMWRRVCVLHAGVCMRGECATCSVPSRSSVNVVAWLQQYLLYSYYFYYCGCLVKPDIITPVELFNCVVEHCS